MSSYATRLRLVVPVLVLAIGAGWAGWNHYSHSARIDGVRNVVLISIDTCRADRLSCYGYKRETTPHIDALARDGVLFQEALTPVPLTTPAHSSMLTGTYPPTHGVRLNNGLALSEASVTLAETLRDAGFKTAAFVGGFPLDAQFGLRQGFDTYDAHFTKTSETTSFPAERSAEAVSRPAMAWLDQHADKPFFLFLHYYDAHLPFEPPPPFASTYADDPYAGEIAYVDSWIGQVVERLRVLHVDDDTLLIVVGDHGESLGEHGEKSHGYFIYQSSEHVPLVVRGPGSRKGFRFDGRVSLVDLVPTVLDVLGMKASSRLDGVSLRAVLEGRTAAQASRPLYCESLEATQFDCASLNGLVDGHWKYIRAPREELYDLAHDALEAHNLADKERPVVERLREHLDSMLDDMSASAVERGASAADPEALRRLQSLGYVGGGAIPDNSKFDPTLEDPKDFAAAFMQIEKANALFHSQRSDEAESVLRSIVEVRPRLVAAHDLLAQLARREHRPAEAVEQYAAIVHILEHRTNRDDLAAAHFNLAFALREAGRDAEAVEHYDQAVRLKPDYVDARNSLGLMLARAGKLRDAIAQYELALTVEPANAQVHNNLGNALLRTGRLADAIGQYEQALKVNPQLLSALSNLADAYAASGRFDEAVTTADRAIAVARAANQLQLAAEIQARATRYRTHRL